MRLLHPDKRLPDVEARAGGRSACDEAMRRVQAALEAAKQEAGSPVPAAPRPPQGDLGDLQQRLRRAQEIQRQQARNAMQRQHRAESGDANAARATGGGGAVAQAAGPGAAGDEHGRSATAVGGRGGSEAPVPVDTVLADLTQALSGGSSPPARTPSSDAPCTQEAAATTAKLIDMLA